MEGKVKIASLNLLRSVSANVTSAELCTENRRERLSEARCHRQDPVSSVALPLSEMGFSFFQI